MKLPLLNYFALKHIQALSNSAAPVLRRRHNLIRLSALLYGPVYEPLIRWDCVFSGLIYQDRKDRRMGKPLWLHFPR